MKKKTRKLLNLVMAAVFLLGMGNLLMQYRDNAGGEEAYQEALEIAMGDPEPEAPTDAASQEETQPQATRPKSSWMPAPIPEDDPNVEALEEIDLKALQEVNPEVIGWIRIPNTKVDYPLMQGEDNDYYLNHTWQGYSNSVGSIYLEYQNSGSMTDYNTIIYGHNMRDGSMFATLRNYTGDFWKEHPYVYIAMPYGVLRYEIFSAYRAELDAPTYGLSFLQRQTRETFLAHAVENSKIDTGIVPEITDQILTLSTCSNAGYSHRWVVQARMSMIRLE